MNELNTANAHVTPATGSDGLIPKGTRLAWLGLICLILGLALLDRGFVGWRNSPWNLPNANGVYPKDEKPEPGKRPPTFHTAPIEIMAESGAILLLLSVVLFGLEPLNIGETPR